MISVIIPVYNNFEVLEKCLASLARQSFRCGGEMEVIVVDDGSTTVINQQLTVNKDLDIRFFRIEHGGAPKARNFGFEKSEGEYVLFCDADLELREDCLEKMFLSLQDNKQAAYTYSDFKYGWKKFKFWEFDADKLRQMNYVNTCSLVRRKDVVKWDEELEKFQDWDFWLQLLDKGGIGVYIPEVLFKVNLGTGSISQWLPKFAYKLPFAFGAKNKYEKWKKVVQDKHRIMNHEL